MNSALLAELSAVVGPDHVLTGSGLEAYERARRKRAWPR